jgi:hypothetical protein
LAKFPPNPKFQDFPVNFLVNFNSQQLPEFWFKFLFESGKVSIRRVVPYLKLFPLIIYLEFLEQGTTFVLSVKIWGKFESV